MLIHTFHYFQGPQICKVNKKGFHLMKIATCALTEKVQALHTLCVTQMVNSPKRVVAAKKREKKNFMENRTINFQAHFFVACTLSDATHLSICLRLMKFFYTHYPYYYNPIQEKIPRIIRNGIMEKFSLWLKKERRKTLWKT